MTSIKLCKTEVLTCNLRFPTELSVAGILKEPTVKSNVRGMTTREYVSYDGHITVDDSGVKKRGRPKKNAGPVDKEWSITITPYYSDVILAHLKIELLIDKQLVKSISVPVGRGEFWSYIYGLANELTEMATDENEKVRH